MEFLIEKYVAELKAEEEQRIKAVADALGRIVRLESYGYSHAQSESCRCHREQQSAVREAQKEFGAFSREYDDLFESYIKDFGNSRMLKKFLYQVKLDTLWPRQKVIDLIKTDKGKKAYYIYCATTREE